MRELTDRHVTRSTFGFWLIGRNHAPTIVYEAVLDELNRRLDEGEALRQALLIDLEHRRKWHKRVNKTALEMKQQGYEPASYGRGRKITTRIPADQDSRVVR